ncbi:ABC transporter permease [Acidobacteriota bacterium]
MTQLFRSPPRFARWLFDWCIPFSESTYLNGDFDEIYNDIFEEKGRGAAARWYWSQILSSLPRIIFQSLFWSFIMLKNYLKMTLRNLKRHKGYSLLNIVGLAVGMACFILIMLYINYEFSYEDHNPNAEYVYSIYVEHHGLDESYPVDSTPVPLAEMIHREIPEIEDFTRIDTFGRSLVAYKDKRFNETGITGADPGVFDIFGFQLLSGDRTTALNDVNSCVLTEEIAEKYFGNEDPMGKTLTMGTSLSLMVRGVIKNHPPNTDFDPGILVSFKTALEMGGSNYSQNWLSQVLDTYILVSENHDVNILEAKMETSFSKYRAKENDERILKLQRLDRLHLHSIFAGSTIRYIYIFLAVGALILLTACINFMNLSTARSASRAREVGMRKVVGAQRKQLIRQFLGESFIYTSLALVLGLALVIGMIPLLKSITGQALSFGQIGRLPIFLSIIGAFVAVGFLSGSYPALYLSSFRPVKVLQRTMSSGKKGAIFRKILVVSQFTISIILIISTFIFSRQIQYMKTKSLGFKQDQIVVVRNQGDKALRNIEPFKQMLENNPKIQTISGSYMLPHSIGMYNEVTWEGAANDEIIAIMHNTVDYDYLETFEIPLLSGRNFSKDFPSDVRAGSGNAKNAGAVILNEESVRRFGWDEPIGKKVIQTFGELRIYYTVIGVVKDFHFSSLKNPIAPLKIFLGTTRSPVISIKIQPDDVQGTMKDIEAAWNRFNPNFPFEYYFYDSVFEQRYQSEQRLQRLFGYFSFLAIFIACLGLFGLASFAAEKRTKEIGIRKILGATNQGMVFLLSREFTKWVAVANLIAWPAAFFLMGNWLKGFAYRIEILDSWPIFFLSGVIALVIAWLTVSFQAIKAALSNPANSLRYE